MSRQAARHHARHHKGLELVWSCHVSDLGDVRLESASNSKSCCNANVRFGTKRTCLPRRRCPLSGAKRTYTVVRLRPLQSLMTLSGHLACAKAGGSGRPRRAFLQAGQQRRLLRRRGLSRQTYLKATGQWERRGVREKTEPQDKMRQGAER